LEKSEDSLATDHRRFFAGLNGSKDDPVRQAFAKGLPPQFLAFCQNFGHDCFKQSFQAAFFDGGHDGNLRKKCAPVNRIYSEFILHFSFFILHFPPAPSVAGSAPRKILLKSP
jgi:hypothetical protein